MSFSDLATLTPYLFMLKCRGYIGRQRLEESHFRRLGWIIFRMNADPKKSASQTMDKVFPSLFEEEKTDDGRLFSKDIGKEWAKIIKKRKEKK